jgi:hypothetical protein
MTEGSEHTEIIMGLLTTVGVAGWTVLQWLQKTDRDRHEDLKEAIVQQFKLAEQNRQTSSDYWRDLFGEMRDGYGDISSRLAKLEERVGAIEIDLLKIDDRVLNDHRPL